MAGLRRTVLERCMLLRAMLPAAKREKMRDQIISSLKREQRLLANAREYRETELHTVH